MRTIKFGGIVNMGKSLAIRGHETRGNEVIELLEMLGGVNGKIDKKTGEPYNVYNGRYFVSEICNVREVAYYIDFESQIRCIDIKDITTDFICYSFEMFLKTFPFKVGNFVRIPEYESEVRILKMKWCPVSKHIEYMVCPNDEEEWFTADELLEDNDNPNEIPKNKEEKKINQMSLANCDLDEVEIVLGDKFELKIEDGKYYAVRKKSRYPKTYEECCNMLNADEFVEYELMVNFPKLINARNAYWKVAGEQLGLDGLWKPDWNHVNRKYYCIYNSKNNIVKNVIYSENKILAFPTEEMRDAFYENFKDLIKACKELL